MYGKPLEELPIKLFNEKEVNEVIKITKTLIKKFTFEEFEKLNQSIYEAYKISKEEVKIIDDFYSKIKITNNT